MTIDNLPRRDITREEARRRTDEFKVHTEAWLTELVSLHDDEVWWALGYISWDDYCSSEFGSIRLPRGASRTGAVLTMRQASLSIRDIDSALGLSRGTVQRELDAADPTRCQTQSPEPMGRSTRRPNQPPQSAIQKQVSQMGQ